MLVRGQSREPRPISSTMCFAQVVQNAQLSSEVAFHALNGVLVVAISDVLQARRRVAIMADQLAGMSTSTDVANRLFISRT
jgi:hypothetical protein